MSTGYGWIFIKWKSYYIVGKVNDAELINDFGLNPFDAKIGTANFNITYFSKTPPAGVNRESFGEHDNLIENITDQAVKQIMFNDEVIEAEIIEKED